MFYILYIHFSLSIHPFKIYLSIYILCIIGVLLKARNFLVFQGDVEAVASKSPQELTKLLEQISGSDQFIHEYDDLFKRKNEAEENTIYSMQKKKMFTTQCREIKGQKDEADYFQDKQDVLWKIYCAKLEMEGKQDEAELLKEELVVIKSNEVELEDELNQAKKEYARIGKTYNQAEKVSSEILKSLDIITPKLAEVIAKLKSITKRIQEQEKNKLKVLKDLELQNETINGLKRDVIVLRDVEIDLKEQLDSSLDSGLKLDQAGLKEYSRLRELVSSRIASERANELTIELDLKSKQELLQR